MIGALFENRQDAGKLLGERLRAYAGRDGVIVLGLPRGGVPVAYEVALALGVPLDVFLVRKLGVPGHEELAMGAIASGGVLVLNDDVVQALRISPRSIETVQEREEQELRRREEAYRGARPFPELEGQTVILVDDGVATGSTMRAAIQAVRGRQPSWMVVAVPVAAPSTVLDLSAEVDEIVCLNTPVVFQAVGQWYYDFSATGDDEVRDLLARATQGVPQPEGPGVGRDGA